MPSIPVASPLAYIGVLFFIVGIFLIITGLDIVRVEKLTVAVGRRSWLTGLLVAIVGVLFLLPEILKTFVIASAPPATPAPSSAPTDALMPASTTTPQTVIDNTPPATVTPPPTQTRVVPQPTPRQATIDAASPTMALAMEADDALVQARAWPLVIHDDFADDATRQDWYEVVPPTGRFELEFNGIFDARMLDTPQPVWATFANVKAATSPNFMASLKVGSTSAAACNYGLAFQIDAASQSCYYIGVEVVNNAYLAWLIDWKDFRSTPLLPRHPLPDAKTVKAITVVKAGDEYRLYANDTFVGSFNDARLTNGRVGIAMVTCSSTAAARFTFDDFELRAR